ncbi:MAG: NUDIX hydrolase [Ignavibacteriae bacterium]|nr:NUDIX hydrolase [Ignavibacteria bacterium]MBI3365372.1 NUDIX hydrolase [Ignavibacteriota bacterium]
MALRTWKKIRQEFELKNPWWTYRKDVTLLPSGKEGEYHYVHVKGSSMVIPQMNDGRLVLVNQYRYLADRESIEFPCGSVKDDSTYDETARHELAEETGFEAAELRVAAEFNPYNGVTDEMCRVYVAKNLRSVESSHDETEEFEQLRLTPQEFDAMIRRGEVWDGMTLAAWSLTRHLFIQP